MGGNSRSVFFTVRLATCRADKALRHQACREHLVQFNLLASLFRGSKSNSNHTVQLAPAITNRNVVRSVPSTGTHVSGAQRQPVIALQMLLS
jgi:hypothetical protein